MGVIGLIKKEKVSNALFFQGIGDYVIRCTQAIGKFESLVHQVHKNADDINNKLLLIESTNLFKSPLQKNAEELPGRLCILYFLF